MTPHYLQTVRHWLGSLPSTLISSLSPEKKIQYAMLAHWCQISCEPHLLNTETLQSADPDLVLTFLATQTDRASYYHYLETLSAQIDQWLIEDTPTPTRALLLAHKLGELRGSLSATQSRFSVEHLNFEHPSIYQYTDEQLVQLCQKLQIIRGQEQTVLTPKQYQFFSEALPAIALVYFRDYQLELGCYILQTIAHWEMSRPFILDQAIPFLRLQQQTAGYFGYLSFTGKSQLEKRQANLINEVYLPITTACVKTLLAYETEMIGIS